MDLIESKIYKSLTPKSKKKPPENVCSIFFENKDNEFLNTARILRDPDIVRSFLHHLLNFLYQWLLTN